MDQSEKVALYSIIFNALLALMKYTLAVFSGSVGLMAHAIDSFTDVISATSVLMGIKLSKRQSKAFPYGLYKVENFVALIMSLLIFAAGFEIFREVLFSHETLLVPRLPFAIAGVITAIVATFLFSRYQLKIGNMLNSPSIIADGEQHKTDMFSSFVILAGLVGGFFNIPYLDKGAALVVVVFIARTGYRIMIDSVRVLLDASLDFETLDNVKTLIMSTHQVKSIKGLWGRNSGRYKFIEAEVILKVKRLEKAHIIIENIEKQIKENIPNVDQVLIHYEPIIKEEITYVVPLHEDQVTISEHFGDAPYYYFVTVRTKDNMVIDNKITYNPFNELKEGKGIKVSEWLVNMGTDKVITRRSLKGKGPFYVFSNAAVEMIITEKNKLQELVFKADAQA